jgi:adenosylcobyric acid synthase
VQALAKRKGIEIKDGVFENYQTFKEKQYDKLADTLRKYLNIEVIYGILKEAHLE